MELKRVGPDYRELPDAYQVAALRGVLTGEYRGHIDMQLAEKNEEGRTTRGNSSVRSTTDKRGGALGNQQATDIRGWPWIQACGGHGHDEEWGGADSWGEEERGHVEEVRKWKGKCIAFRGNATIAGSGVNPRGIARHWEKGFSGACYN